MGFDHPVQAARQAAAQKLFITVHHLVKGLQVDSRLEPLYSRRRQEVEKGKFFLQEQDLLLELQSVSERFIF
ncbi:MAG: hypothetical protein AB1641_00180 [Thermodesulfobacteriota bacterium]